MADEEAICFEMGLHRAPLPGHLRYCDIHFWFEPLPADANGPARTRVGLTSYAARLLSDVFRLEWTVKAGETLHEAQALGEIESTKASSELYSPMAGKLLAINEAMAKDPDPLSLDPYAAWLLEFEGHPQASMDVSEYKKFLEDGWDETQKLLKGQM